MSSKSLGTLVIDMVARIGGWTDGLNKAERELDKRTKRMNKMAYDFGRSFGASIRSAATGFLAFAGVTVSIGAVTSSLKSAIDRADELRDASIRLGVGVDVLSKWSYAAKQTGTDIDSLQTGLKILAKNATDALNPKSQQAGLFAALGISKDQLTDLSKLVPAVADAFQRLPDGVQKAAAAQQLFGKSGLELTEFFNSGAEGIKEYGDKLENLGGVITPEAAAAADKFNDDLDDLKTAFGGVANKVAQDLLPKLDEFVTDLNSTSTRQGLATIIEGLADIVTWSAKAATALGGIAHAVQVAMGSAADAKQYDEILAKRAQLEEQLARQTSKGLSGAPDPISKLLGFDKGQSAAQLKAEIAELDKRRAALFAQQTAQANRVHTTVTNFVPKGKNNALADYFAGGSSGGKSDAKKQADDLKRLIEAQDDYHAHLLDMTADLSGPVAQVNRDYEKQLADLNEAYAAGKVRQEDYAKAQELLAQKRDADLKAIREQGAHQWDAMVAQLNGPLAEAELDHIERLKEIQEQGELAGKTADEIAAAKAKETDAYNKTTEAIKAQLDAMANPEVVEVMDTFRRSFTDNLTDLVTGAESAKDAIKNFLDDIAQAITRAIAQDWGKRLLGDYGTTGGGGWASLLGAFFGDSSFGSGPEGFASGGMIGAGSLAMVNERGFEMASVGGRDYLLTGSKPVRITPNHKLPGSGITQVNNFNYQRPYDAKTAMQTAQQVGYQAKRAAARNGG